MSDNNWVCDYTASGSGASVSRASLYIIKVHFIQYRLQYMREFRVSIHNFTLYHVDQCSQSLSPLGTLLYLF